MARSTSAETAIDSSDPCTLLSLPPELLVVVTEFLTEIGDINALALTSWKFRNLVRSRQLRSVCFDCTLKSWDRGRYLQEKAFLCTFIRQFDFVPSWLPPQQTDTDLVRTILSQSPQIQHLNLAGPC